MNFVQGTIQNYQMQQERDEQVFKLALNLFRTCLLKSLFNLIKAHINNSLSFVVFYFKYIQKVRTKHENINIFTNNHFSIQWDSFQNINMATLMRKSSQLVFESE